MADAEAAAHHAEKRVGCVRFLRALRLLVAITLVFHIGASALALAMALAAASSTCPRSLVVCAAVVATGACVRVAWVVGAGVCQAATALTMIAEEHIPASRVTSAATPTTVRTRLHRRAWYARWLWWGRFGAIVTTLQAGGACYLTILAVRNAHSSFCSSGSDATAMLQDALVVLPITAWLLVFLQCCVGSDVLSWRSLYQMQDEVWRAHYRQMFDHGIRELLCCLGRSRYMTRMDEDEVDAVAALLGDLVAYRAVGASHLEFLAGVALLRTRGAKSSNPVMDFPPAPGPLVTEAAALHLYAVAAYTGPLLDIGRTPLVFLCVWMYRQGLLTLWKNTRKPKLDGDNWWRGHATAFLAAARVPPEALLKGRIHQRNRETVYFIIELRELKLVVVAVRGTETPEDLLTDGLGRECILSDSDICGLLRSSHLSDTTKQEISSSSPHYGHAGVVAAARELAYELESPEDNPGGSSKVGFLTSILGPGGKCEGFALRFCGHSLGGSIAAVAGMMLWHRFPNLHTYGYGVLPCVDAVIAEACSAFVTSVVYNDEFSSRLSVASLMRLRADSLQALAADSESEPAVISRLARRLFVSRRRSKMENGSSPVAPAPAPVPAGVIQASHRRRRCQHKLKGGVFLCCHACYCVMGMPKVVEGRPVGNGIPEGLRASSNVELTFSMDAGAQERSNSATATVGREEKEEEEGKEVADGEVLSNGIPIEAGNNLVGFEPGCDLQELWPVELVIPGLVIHLLRVEEDRSSSTYWCPGRSRRRRTQHRAVLRARDDFRDVVVSPSMFVDHMPWRCQGALNDVLEQVPTEPLGDDPEAQVGDRSQS